MRVFCYKTFLPNGISDISINLKCCLPQGMPMMVIHNNNPITTCTMAVYKPPQSNQIILNSIEKQPALLLSLTTFLPKGHNTKPANLKHCTPHGMPRMVMHKTMPPTKYPSAASKPPKMSQMRLPRRCIFLYW